MQFPSDLTCSKCKTEFEYASDLLQHYATHVLEEFKINYFDKKKQIPNLYPILKKDSVKTDNESDSGFEDINPIKYCMVTMEDSESTSNKNHLKKYRCIYCSKRFGWSTDLKRHILIHTGERPFKCKNCDQSFTRKFLLQNHLRKAHDCNIDAKLPLLKPIFSKKQIINS